MIPLEPGASTASAWLVQLRERFVGVARRRVPADAVEDVVQDALRVVVERGLSGPGARAADGEPGLAFCFQVLRNVIGNYYQKERVRQRRWEPEDRARSAPDAAPAPLEALVMSDALRLVESCLLAMDANDPACARYLRRLAEGLAPASLAAEEKLEETVLYRRVYRCRIKLRSLLGARGYFA